MFEFGTIILVPFPFTDLTSAKIRPALLISKDGGHGDDVIVSFISSKPYRGKFGIPLAADAITGLKVRSVVRFDKIATLSKKIVLGELGRMDKDNLHSYRDRFMGTFGFGK